MLKEELYSYGVLPLFAITGGVIAIAMFANSWICDANFYSGYFEGDLDGRVEIKELAPLIVLDLKSRRVEILWYFSRKNSLQIKLIL